MSQAYELMEAEEAEVTMEQAFGLALTDDNFHDVTLEGSDGVRVRAVRTLLALRSKVFCKMLCGDFQEATQDVVKVDYPGAVVKAIVEYIHTNNTEILVQPSQPSVDEEDTNKDKEIPETCHELFQTLLTLTMAAAYYNLPKLCHKAHDCLSSYTDRFPKLSYAVLTAFAGQAAAISEEMKQKALLDIRQCMSLDLNDRGLELLSPAGLKLAISSDAVCMSERYRFQLIEMWSSIAGADQQDAAKNLIKDYVKLDLMDPDFLSAEVTMSGLVTTEQLLEAYQHQAKRAKNEHNISFESNIVSNPMWKTTNSYLFQMEEDDWKGDSLQVPALTKNHSYQWTIQISSMTTAVAQVWLGVMSTTAAENALEYCGSLDQSWGIYGYEGQEWSSQQRGKVLGEAAEFAGGSTVVVTLDLSPEEENNGSLSISADGKPAVLVLGGMCTKLDDIDGFIPTVSCSSASATIVNLTQF